MRLVDVSSENNEDSFENIGYCNTDRVRLGLFYVISSPFTSCEIRLVLKSRLLWGWDVVEGVKSAFDSALDDRGEYPLFWGWRGVERLWSEGKR